MMVMKEAHPSGAVRKVVPARCLLNFIYTCPALGWCCWLGYVDDKRLFFQIGRKFARLGVETRSQRWLAGFSDAASAETRDGNA